MATKYDGLTTELVSWIQAQKIFFVATAPGAGEHVNCSPKGLPGSLRIVDAHTIEYDDWVGSGIETLAHLRDNGRICVMFCAFEGPPRIVRLHGRGEALPTGAPESGIRAIIRVHIARIADSCGYGVPLMAYQGERTQMQAWVDRKGPEGLREFVRKHNETSLDGLPGLAR